MITQYSSKSSLETASSSTLTPMMAQYFDVKAKYPQYLLFFRMGDFYEMFFEDAVKAAAALNITLTRRGKHQGEDIPMCGIPFHASEAYLSRLIRQGYRVAVCEQTNSPLEERKGGKNLIRRDVVRVVTPGTLTEEALLDSKENNFLVAIAQGEQKELALGAVDLSTGTFIVESTETASLGSVLARFNPHELLLEETILQEKDLKEMLTEWQNALVVQPVYVFALENAQRRLQEMFGVMAEDSIKTYRTAEIKAAGAIIDYLFLTQKQQKPRLEFPKHQDNTGLIEIDPATRRSLELLTTLTGEKANSVLSVIDKTLTSSGARLLASRLASPIVDITLINGRLEFVSLFIDKESERLEVRRMLPDYPDMERALARLALNRGGPRDLAAIASGLSLAVKFRDYFIPLLASWGYSEGCDEPVKPSFSILGKLCRSLGHPESLIKKLMQALGDDLPVLARDGGFVRSGYCADLDHLKTLRENSRHLIVNLQQRYSQETTIPNLKIRHNNILGYYIEISPNHVSKIPESFIHRQTLANVARYTTVDLHELEGKINAAADQALALEQKIFQDILEEVLAYGDHIIMASQGIATLDVTTALAELAIRNRYVRPLVDNSLAFDIQGGRHPVIEVLRNGQNNQPFIPNDCCLSSPHKLWLLTGPNMAGKSTFLRQNALIVILAQMGSFVPATFAHIGVVDRLFSRVGAADDLARGRSTFMVEMIETATILHQATPRSLVILDEIGRGTSTFDGVSIAWAAVEHLHNHNQCRGLFATHYHELTQLASQLSHLKCYTMRIKEWADEIAFLHEVIEGCADRSYGIHVARLAGVPLSVIERAEIILKDLESSGKKSEEIAPLLTQTYQGTLMTAGQTRLLDSIKNLNINEITARQALDILYHLKEMIEEKNDKYLG